MSWPEPIAGPVQPPEISVMTLNVRRARARSRDWRRRAPRVQALLARERPTILGVQEALPGQMRSILAALGSGYRALGAGRAADGQGEGCPLFVDADRLEVQDWTQSALSPRPHVPGSRGWGALFPRILVRALLRDRVEGTVFTAVNTHLDVLSPRARVRAAELVAAAVPPGPAVVTADFNEGPDAPARRLLDDAGLRDTWLLADTHLTRSRGTFAPHRRADPRGRRIDAVLTRGWDVSRVAIDARPIAGGWASDHAAALAVLRAPGGGE